MIVVDTNVVVGLVVGGEEGSVSRALLEQDGDWAAPGLLLSELRNALLGYVRRGSLTPEQAKAMCDDALLIVGDRIFNVTDAQVIDTALECGLTAYDAEFVVLARTLGVSLATHDRAILAGAPDVAADPVSWPPA